jgi:FAD/FMN-containing dehydrogenase/Fe-S oxidoreductase
MLAAGAIRDDLRGLFRGELHFDDAMRSLYAHDGSPLKLMPFGVAIPHDVEDLALFVKYAHENRIPLIPRGAGTGVSGGVLGAGLVLDMVAHFRQVLELGPDWVRVQPGVSLAPLNRALATHGRRISPNPERAESRSLGGMVATDGCGPNVSRWGYLREHLLAVNVALDTGEIASIVEPGFTPSTTSERGPRFIELRARTAALMAEHRDLIQLTRPLTKFTRAGYQLHDILTPTGLNLTRLFAGSEGTLGILTEVTLRTHPLPGGESRVLIGFENVDQALHAGLALLPVAGVVSCELLDQRLLAAAHRTKSMIPVPAHTVGAALVVAIEMESISDALEVAIVVVETVRKEHTGELLADPTVDPDAIARIDRFRTAALSGLHTLGPGPRPARGCEDVAVPVEELARFVPALRSLIRQFDLSVPLHIHVHAGQVSAMPMLDLRLPDDRQKLWAFAEAVHTLALSLGGTISTREGTGLLRAPWLDKQFGPLLNVFRQVKEIYDPSNILHPGVLFDADPSRPAWPFPPVAERIALPAVEVAVASCNNCGDCRTTTGRMCPVFHALPTEAASPRAKANLWRGDPATVATPEAEAIAKLCVNCKMCQKECPSQVDIPRLMIEAKAAHFQEHGLARGEWVTARIEGLSMLAGMFAFTANFTLSRRAGRWLIEKLFGISRYRTLPRFTHRTFMRRALRQRLTGRRAPIRGNESSPDLAFGQGEKIVYFVDLFANFHDPSIGLATVQVLKHHGIEVYVPWRQRSSGMAALVHGDLDTARDFALANLRTLAPLVREGYRIVVSDPTAALALTQEYPMLIDTPDAKFVAENTVELTAYLWSLHEAGKLRTDFEPLAFQVGHHVPCHIKALGDSIAGPKLLALIPGLTVQTIDKSCSGMAGTYGLQAVNYQASLTAGQPMLEVMQSDSIAYGSTECGACRMQMHTGARKRTLHPIQYLALAYGLMPELRTKLARPLGRLVSD